MTTERRASRDLWITQVYPDLLGPHIPQPRITAKQHTHDELVNVVRSGFKPRMIVDDLTPGDNYSALHASFKTALAATDLRSFVDYVLLLLSEVSDNGIDYQFPTYTSPEIELDRLVAKRNPDGTYLFPTCQLGVLTWEEAHSTAQGYATVYERESADWTIWVSTLR